MMSVPSGLGQRAAVARSTRCLGVILIRLAVRPVGSVADHHVTHPRQVSTKARHRIGGAASQIGPSM